MNVFTISIISLVISGLSATVAVLSFTSNRSLLIFFKDKDNTPAPIIPNEIYALVEENGKTRRIPFPEGFLYHIQVFNPSPKDIAFFHMGFIFDQELPIGVWTQATFGWLSKTPKVLLDDPLHGSSEIYIPVAPQGVFKAHSFTPLYFFARTDNHPFPKDVELQFKYAVRKFPYIGKNTHYKTFRQQLDVSNTQYEIGLKKDTMKQLTQQVPQSPKPKQTPPFRRRHKIKRKYKNYNK